MRHSIIVVGMLGLTFAPGAAGAAGAGEVCEIAPDQPSIYDLGPGTYKGFEGGFYAGGVNERPPAHEAAGRARALAMQPLAPNGQPDPDGAIVMISIGYSNMTQEWAAGAVGEPASRELTFRAKTLALQEEGLVNPRVRVIDGAVGGTPAFRWAVPPGPDVFPWTVPLERLAAAQLTRFQVQVAAVKTSSASPTECLADDGSGGGAASETVEYFGDIARNLKTAFPNIKLVYFVTRSYGGYALTGLMPEPFAFEQGFAVRWIVDTQIRGSNEYGDLTFEGPDAPAPWLSYGPLLWANGETPNGQGLSWSPEDYREDDRTHPSGSGVDKAADVFLAFFTNDTTTRPWFLTPRGRCPEDLDESGAVDFGDILLLLTAWGPCPGCPEDLDGNGAVGFADLVLLLGAWGPCE